MFKEPDVDGDGDIQAPIKFKLYCLLEHNSLETQV